MALCITQMLCGVPSELLFKFCFCIFVGKASLIMTYHLHQLDTINYLLLELLKLIGQVSTKSYFPTVPVLIYEHPGPRVCWSSLPSTKVHYRHVMVPSHHRSSVQYHLESYAHWPRVSRGGRTGSARGLPVRPPREEQMKHETKPRRNLGNHAFCNNRVFVLLIA